MGDFLLPFLIAFFAFLIWLAVDTAKAGVAAEKEREMCIERREEFVKSMGPGVRTIINNGTDLLFIDDEKKSIGIDESGETIKFSELCSISIHDQSLSAITEAPIRNSFILSWGDVRPLNKAEIMRIADALMPIVRKNLSCELKKYHVLPTYEYEHDGEIWGCDINSKQFYAVAGCQAVHKFSALKKVTVEDLTKNSICNANYIIHVIVKDADDWMDMPLEYEIYFKNRDKTFYDLLAMFKGIRNRA